MVEGSTFDGHCTLGSFYDDHHSSSDTFGVFFFLVALQDICQRPTFIANGSSRFDVEQGELGDPWLLAAISSLTLTPRFLDRVVPPDQNFDLHYCGMFRCEYFFNSTLVHMSLSIYIGL